MGRDWRHFCSEQMYWLHNMGRGLIWTLECRERLKVFGRLLIGLVEAFYASYFSAEYKDVAVFAILILVLVFRPSGLLGRPEVEKV